MAKKQPAHQRQLTNCCNHATALCQGAADLHNLVNDESPDWSEVSDAMGRMWKASAWLISNWGALELYDGLRPDAVVLDGCAYRSWHAAVAELFAFDGHYLVTGVWGGTDPERDGMRWTLGPWLDWLRGDLGLPAGGEWANRSIVWDRIREMSFSVSVETHARLLARGVTTLPKVIPDHLKDMVSWRAWLHLRSVNLWEWPVRLMAEYRYAQRHLSVYPPLPRDLATTPRRAGGRKPTPLKSLSDAKRLATVIRQQYPDLPFSAVVARVREDYPEAKQRDIKLAVEAQRKRDARARRKQDEAA